MVSIKRNDAEKLFKAVNSKDECFMHVQLTNDGDLIVMGNDSNMTIKIRG